MLAALLFASPADEDTSAPRAGTHGRGPDGARIEQDQRIARRDQSWAESLTSADESIASAALSALIEAYFDRLVRFAYGFVTSGDTAEDLVQETFVRLWETRRALHLTSSLRSYLFTAVRHRALNVLKHTAVEGRHATDVQASAEPVILRVEDQLDAASVELAVRAAIAHLPERRRTVIRLRYEEELPFQAVAEIMGISEKAAKDLTARTIRELRTRLRLE
jgi:RNA polymerase sigma-70 factor (ECF subfamily)